MSRIKISKNFYLDEYIPRELYQGNTDRIPVLIGLLDIRLILSDQLLRDRFGPITINNWMTGGNRNESGIRIPSHKHYSPTSQHTFARASDKIFKNATAEEVRQEIIKKWPEHGIACIEKKVSWLHSDTRWIPNQEKLLIV